jgi:hypothetical protein
MLSVSRNVAKSLVTKGVQAQSKAAMSTIVLPDLAFDYGALEPVVRNDALIINAITVTYYPVR